MRNLKFKLRAQEVQCGNIKDRRMNEKKNDCYNCVEIALGRHPNVIKQLTCASPTYRTFIITYSLLKANTRS